MHKTGILDKKKRVSWGETREVYSEWM